MPDSIDALWAKLKPRILALLTSASASTSASGGRGPISITTEDELTSLASVAEIRVTDDKLTDNGGGSASLDLTGSGIDLGEESGVPIEGVKSLTVPDGTLTNDGGGAATLAFNPPLTVSDEAETPVVVTPVTGIIFSEGRVTDNEDGTATVDLTRVLAIAEPGDDPRVFPVTEIRVPEGTLTDLGDGNVELTFGTPLTVTEEDDDPGVTPVSQIRVPNGVLIDNGSGSVSLDLLGLSTWGGYISFLARMPVCRGAWGMSPVDASGNTYDASGLGKTLSPISSYYYAGGIVRDAYPLTGVVGQLERASEADNQITGTEAAVHSTWQGLTLVVWGLSTSNAATQGILGKWNATGNQRSYLLEKTSAPSYKFSISDDGTTVFSVTSSVTPSIPDDIFFAASFLPSTSIDIWVGTTAGVLTHDTFTTSIPSGIHSGSANLQMGAYNAGSNLWTGLFFGAGLYAACLNVSNTIQTIYDYGRKTIPFPLT